MKIKLSPLVVLLCTIVPTDIWGSFQNGIILLCGLIIGAGTLALILEKEAE